MEDQEQPYTLFNLLIGKSNNIERNITYPGHEASFGVQLFVERKYVVQAHSLKVYVLYDAMTLV